MAYLFPKKYYKGAHPITDVRTGGLPSVLSKLPSMDFGTKTSRTSARMRKSEEKEKKRATLFPEKYYEPAGTTQGFFDRLKEAPSTAMESFKMGTYQSMAALAASESNIMDALRLDKIAPKKRRRLGESYSFYRDLTRKQAAKLPPEDPDKPLEEKLKDPLWYARGVSQMLPNTIGAIVVGVSAAVATGGNPFVGTAAAYAYSSMLEGGSAYMEAKEAGATEKQADNAAIVVGAINGALELVPIWNWINDTPSGKMLQKGLVRRITSGMLLQGIEEGVTEPIQEVVSNAATGFYEENPELVNQAVAEVGILAFISGGLIGGPGAMRGVSVEAQLDIEGLPEPLREPLKPALAEVEAVPPEIMPIEEVEPIVPEIFMEKKAEPIGPRTAEELIEMDKLRPQTTGWGQGKYWQYRAEDGIYTVAPNKTEAVKRANEALRVQTEEEGVKEVPEAVPETAESILKEIESLEKQGEAIPTELAERFDEISRMAKEREVPTRKPVAEIQTIKETQDEIDKLIGFSSLGDYRYDHYARPMFEDTFLAEAPEGDIAQYRELQDRIEKIRQEKEVPIEPAPRVVPPVEAVSRPEVVSTEGPPMRLEQQIAPPPAPPTPEDPDLDAYQRELLEEIRARPLPEIEPAGAEWRPTTLGYKNPYTRTVYGLWDKLVDNISGSKVIGKLTPREGRTQKSYDLLKEKVRIADGLYRRSKEDYVKPLEKLDPKVKTEIGLMVNKYVPVTQEYAGVIKDIDAEIGRYGDVISSLYEKWVANGWVEEKEVHLPREVFLENLGRYSRTFYLRPEKGRIKGKPALFTDPNKIATGMFKKKMTLEDWGRAALLHDNKVENRNVSGMIAPHYEFEGKKRKRIPFSHKVTRALEKQGVKITDLAAMSEQDVLEKIPFKAVEVGEGRHKKLVAKDNTAKRMIKEASKLIQPSLDGESRVVVDMTDAELQETGKQAKMDYGWMTQADAMIEKTLKDLVSNYAVMSYFDAIRNDPELFSEETKEGFIAVSDLIGGRGERDVRLGPLNEGYVHPSLQQDLQLMLKYEPENAFNYYSGQALAWWKFAKTGGAPATMARNFLSGSLWQTDMAGAPVWDPRNAPVYIKGVKDYLTKNERYDFWRDQGLYGADYHTVEIEQNTLKRIEKAINPMAELGTTLADKTFAKPKAAKLKEKLTYYGAIDHLARTYLAEWSLSKEATPKQAIEFANKWQLNYKFVPQIIEALRGGKGAVFGAFMPFASFAYLIAPRILETIVARPWVLLKYPIMVAAVTALSKSILGVSDEEEKAQRPEWLSDESNWTMLLPQRDEKGDIQYMSLDYIFPFGKPGPGNLYTFVDVNQAQQMLQGGVPIYQAGINVINNYDPFSGEKIYLGDDDPDKAEKIAAYLAKQVGPTGVYDAERLWKAFSGEEIGYPIKHPRSKKQALMRAGGIPIYSGGLNVVEGKIRDEEEALQNVEKMMRMVLTDDTLSEKQRTKKFNKLLVSMEEHIDKISELYAGFPKTRTTGVETTPSDIIRTTPSGGNLFPDKYYR